MLAKEDIQMGANAIISWVVKIFSLNGGTYEYIAIALTLLQLVPKEFEKLKSFIVNVKAIFVDGYKTFKEAFGICLEDGQITTDEARIIGNAIITFIGLIVNVAVEFVIVVGPLFNTFAKVVFPAIMKLVRVRILRKK